MAKEPKYSVEKSEGKADGIAGKPYWMLWINDNDVIFWDEKTAFQVRDALNLAEEMRKITRKARDLSNALAYFGEDN